MNVLYVVVPNYVPSRTGRERHWISATQLVKLYHLTHYRHYWEVVLVHREDPPALRQAKVEEITGDRYTEIRLLEPRHDGEYKQPPGNVDS